MDHGENQHLLVEGLQTINEAIICNDKLAVALNRLLGQNLAKLRKLAKRSAASNTRSIVTRAKCGESLAMNA
jgi:hypothetical protein